MCGKDNRYGHPHQEVLNRLAAAGVQVLRTDNHGTIVMSTTKDAVIIETLVDDATPRPDPGYVTVPEPGPEPAPDRVNINTAVFSYQKA